MVHGRLVFLTGFALASTVLGCANGTETTSAVKTELGKAGDAEVVMTYGAYKPSCAAAGTGRHVILTGFGLFNNDPTFDDSSNPEDNVSGIIAQSFANAAFAPSPLITSAVVKDSGANASGVARGIVPASASGGLAQNRSVVINGNAYEICFLTLDVKWDLAAAIVLKEASAGFAPEMILMMGRNGDDTAVFEKSAANVASIGSVGYKSNGNDDVINDPTNNAIFSSKGAPGVLQMTWNNAALASAMQDQITAIGYTTEAPTAWRDDNDYICNNISYVVLAAAQGLPISLAGDGLQIQADVAANTKIGFLHLPDDADFTPEHIHGWINVVAGTIDLSLAPTRLAGSATENLFNGGSVFAQN